MKWMNNLISIAKMHKAGECPYCKSSNTDYGFKIVVSEEQLGYGVVWCNDCKKAYHMSRVEVKGLKIVKSFPEDLKFT